METENMEFELNLNDVSYEIGESKQLEARIEALETMLIKYIAEKEFKEEDEIRYEYEGLQAEKLFEVISEFISKYGTGNQKNE
jgi:hypothetical protein